MMLKHTIIQTEEWRVIDELCAQLDETTLAIWDVDGTLIVPEETLFYPQNLTYDKQGKIVEAMEAGQRKAIKDSQFVHAKWYEVWRTLPFKLMDEQVPHTLKLLQQREISSIALTLLLVCTYDGKDFVQWRVNQLKAFGIDFSQAFAHFPYLKLEEILHASGVKESLEDWIFAPVFKDGVLLTHHWPKGECLQLFLNRLSYKPKKIFFVDDLESNILSVGDTCKHMGIDYQGVHYKGYMKLENPWTEEKAREKWQHFFKLGRWKLDKGMHGIITQ